MLVTTLPLDSTSRTHFKPRLTQAPASCSENCTFVSHRLIPEPYIKVPRKRGCLVNHAWSTWRRGETGGHPWVVLQSVS